MDENELRAKEKKNGREKSPGGSIDREKILAVIDILKKNPDIQEIMVSADGIRVVQFPAEGHHMVRSHSFSSAIKEVSAAPEKKETDGVGKEVMSPMVGTAYMAPKPGDAPFVKVGDVIQKDQIVMIIEAMKLMNPIKSPLSGRVSKICVENAAPVEYEQVLLYIEPM